MPYLFWQEQSALCLKYDSHDMGKLPDFRTGKEEIQAGAEQQRRTLRRKRSQDSRGCRGKSQAFMWKKILYLH